MLSILQGNDFTLVLPMYQYVSATEQEPIDTTALTDLVVTYHKGGEVPTVAEDVVARGNSLLVPFDETLAQGVYSLHITAKLDGRDVASHLRNALRIVRWNQQADVKDSIAGTEQVMPDTILIATVDAENLVKDHTINTLTTVVSSQQGTITSQQRTIAEQEDTIENQELTIQQQEQDIMELDEYIENYDPMVREMIGILRNHGIYVNEDAVDHDDMRKPLRYLVSVMRTQFPEYFDTDPVVLPPVTTLTVPSNIEVFDCRGVNFQGSSLADAFSNKRLLRAFRHSSYLNTSQVTNLNSMFYKVATDATITDIDFDLSGLNTSNVTTMASMFFEFASKNPHQNDLIVNMTGVSAASVTSCGLMFANTYLKNIVGGLSYEQVVEQDIKVLVNLGSVDALTNANLCNQSYTFNRASKRAIINGLADRTGKPTATLSSHFTTAGGLSAEDIAVATAKNWTVA